MSSTICDECLDGEHCNGKYRTCKCACSPTPKQPNKPTLADIASPTPTKAALKAIQRAVDDSIAVQNAAGDEWLSALLELIGRKIPDHDLKPQFMQKVEDSIQAGIAAAVAEAEVVAKEQGFYMACGVAGISLKTAATLWPTCLAELQSRQAASTREKGAA